MHTSKRSWQPWYTVVVLCALGWVLLYAGRAVLSPLLGTIGAEWGLDEAQLGLISSVFFFAYAGMQIPTGLLADRFGKKGLLVGGFFLFAVATALRGLAPGYVPFLVAGGLAGLAQGSYYATQFAISSAAIPPARRGLGSALVYSGMAVGTSLGYIFGGLAVSDWGMSWRGPFLLLAAPTALLGSLFVWKLRESPEPGRGASEGATTNAVKTSPVAPLRAALSPGLLATYAVNFCSLYTFFMLLSWLPYYLQYERGLSGPLTGVISSLIPWASIPAALVVSTLSDRIGSRLGPLRLLLPAAALSLVGVARAGSGVALYAFLVLYGLTGKSTADALLTAHTSELTPPGRSATALGFLNFAGMVASVLAPYVTGLLTRASGSMRSSFDLAAVILLIGFAITLLASRRVGRRTSPLAGQQAD